MSSVPASYPPFLSNTCSTAIFNASYAMLETSATKAMPHLYKNITHNSVCEGLIPPSRSKPLDAASVGARAKVPFTYFSAFSISLVHLTRLRVSTRFATSAASRRLLPIPGLPQRRVWVWAAALVVVDVSMGVPRRDSLMPHLLKPKRKNKHLRRGSP